MTTNILKKLESLRPFTEKEAWTLFRLAAISEAIGWTLLISGILIVRYVTPGNNDAVIIAGQIHGMIFLTYIVAVGVLYSSLDWSRKRTIIAGLASVPPYGSLIFEQWAAYKRRGTALKNYREVIVHAIIIKEDTILVIQPKETGFWHLPGGTVQAKETAEEALRRIVQEQTGVMPVIGRIVYIFQHRDRSTEQLEMFFNISNSAAYEESELKAMSLISKVIDDIQFIQPKGNKTLQPAFLQREPIVAHAKDHTRETLFIAAP